MTWRENLLNMAFNLSLYTHTSIPDAMSMPVSLARDFFESKPFDDWRKSKEAEAKAQGEIITRLNGVIGSIGILAKSLKG